MSWNLLKLIKINIFSFVLPFLFKSHLRCFLKPCDIRRAWNVRTPHRYIQLLKAFFGCQIILTALHLLLALIFAEWESTAFRALREGNGCLCQGDEFHPFLSVERLFLYGYFFISISNNLCHMWEMQIDLVATEPKSCNGLLVYYQ